MNHPAPSSEQLLNPAQSDASLCLPGRSLEILSSPGPVLMQVTEQVTGGTRVATHIP
jgi:hypothetical protein